MKVTVLESILSIRVSFVLVRVDRRLCSGALTHPSFEENTSSCSVFSFVVVEAAVWRMGSK